MTMSLFRSMKLLTTEATTAVYITRNMWPHENICTNHTFAQKFYRQVILLWTQHMTEGVFPNCLIMWEYPFDKLRWLQQNAVS